MTLKQSIGSQIKALRLAAGLNQAGLANRMGTSKQYVSQIEAGLVTLSFEQVEKFAQVLGASVTVTLVSKGAPINKAAKAIRNFGIAASRAMRKAPKTDL
jgi:transcriptional regulator with XRE-family HTH domain